MADFSNGFLAHNLMADFHHTALVGTRFEAFGPKRIVRDLLAIPGRMVFEDTQLKRMICLNRILMPRIC